VDASGVEDGDAPVAQPTTNAAVRSNVSIAPGGETRELCIRLFDAAAPSLLPIGGPVLARRTAVASQGDGR
jgi:hypothetical protein